jgi:hypothetical protein
MFDDGLHNDGAAGDNVYGTSISMTTAEGQYYIYAENDNAGKFSPQRAEHEFYTITANAQVATLGDLVINEFLASNQTDAMDVQSQHDDWIEIYNLTNETLSLSGLYLSDDVTNFTKFAFPASAIIQPNGYLIVWADQDISSTSEIHCNFKLSSLTDIIILSDGNSTVFDSLTYFNSIPDISFGRCPDGIGAFDFQNPTTFNAPNCYSGIDENNLEKNVTIYPNPTSDFFTVQFTKNGMYTVQLVDQLGRIVDSKKTNFDSSIEFSTKNLSSGVYIVKIASEIEKNHLIKISIIN